MQLGELQSQIARFERRGVAVIAVSVDLPDDSLGMVERLGLSFDLGSDPEQDVVEAFGVQNPDTQELALHAVYIIDRDARVFYRKVARRRPTSEELIDAVDAFEGAYPQRDVETLADRRIEVAYPENQFQALIEISRAPAKLPATVDVVAIDRVYALMTQGRGDDALVAFRTMARNSDAARADLYGAAAWLARQVFLKDDAEALRVANDLRRRIDRVAQLESERQAVPVGSDLEDELIHQVARARAGLVRVRAEVNRNAAAWNLRYAKSVLRSYREVVRVAKPV